MLRAQWRVLGAVQGSKGHFLVARELVGRTHEFWFGSLAVATPGGIEHDQSMLLFLEEWSEVFISKVGYLVER